MVDNQPNNELLPQPTQVAIKRKHGGQIRTKAGRARPIRHLDKSAMARICEYIEFGIPVEKIEKAIGIHRKQWAREEKRNPVFATQLKKAWSIRGDENNKILMHGAREGALKGSAFHFVSLIHGTHNCVMADPNVSAAILIKAAPAPPITIQAMMSGDAPVSRLPALPDEGEES